MSAFLTRIKEVSRLSPAAKSSLVLMATQMVQKGLQILTTPILTRFLTNAEYGQVSVFFSWYEIMIIFTEICLSKGVFNNGMMDFKLDRDCFSLSMYALTLVSTVTIGAGVTLFCRFIWNFMGLPVYLIAYMFFLQAFEGALSMWSVRQRFEFKYKALAAVTITIAILSPICGIVGIVVFRRNPVTANIVCSRSIFLVAYFVLLLLLIKRAKGHVKLSYWKYALKFNLPLIPHYLSQHILNHMDRIQIAAIAGQASAGIYSLAYSGAAVVKLVWTSINASLIPWTYEKCEKGQFKEIDSLTRLLVLGYGIICAVVMFLAPEVVYVLAPASYYEGIYVIPSVIIGVYFSALYFIFANVVYYYKRPKYVMAGSVISAVVNVVLNALFIPRYGFLAAGYTTMISYLLQSAVDYWAMRKVSPDKIYDMRYIIGISVGVVAIGLVLNFIYGYQLLRYSLLLILVLYSAFYLRENKETIMQLLMRRGDSKQ